MKKIYILTAVFALLTLSLNAQVDTKAKPISKSRLASFSFNDVLRGIKGMDGILNFYSSASSSSNGQWRAPLRYDSEQYETLGPFTGDNFTYGIGFPEAYPDGTQDILVTTVLNRSEYANYIGENIVGFRFALWGDAGKTVKVRDFITYPYNTNGFDQNHLYEWTLTDLEGNEPGGGGDEPGATTKYVKVTSSSDLTSGEYLIVCEAQNVIFDGSTTALNGSNYAAAPTISNSAIEYTEDLDGKDFTIDMSNGTVKSSSGYYIGCESSNNAVSFNQNTQYTNTISVNDGTASIIYRYNNADRPLKCNTSNNVFRYYKTSSSGVADIQLYKKVTTSSKAPRRADRAGEYVLLNDAIDGSKYSTGVDIDGNLSAPWSATYLRNQSGNILYIRSGGSMVFTVPSGYNNANFKFVFKTSTSYYNGYFTFTPSNGAAQQVNTSAASTEYEYECQGLSSGNTVTITGQYSSYAYSPDFMYMYVYVQDSGDDNDGYALLEPGQWHEFYLDQPVEFQMEDGDDQLFMGYWYKQYPLTSQNEEAINPAAVNSESTGHSHYVNMITGTAGSGDLVVHLPYSMNVRTITVYDTNGNSLTTWDAATAYSNSDYTSVSLDGSTYAAYNMPTGWSISEGNYFLSWNSSSVGRLGYLLGEDDITIASSALNGNTTVRVVLYVYDDNGSGTITVNGESKTTSGTSLANYTWDNVNLTAPVYDRAWHSINLSEVGDLAVQLIFESQLPKTDTPVITVTEGDAAYTITATGNGTVTMVVGGQTYTSDEGSVSVTINRGNTDQTVAVSATAQEEGKRVSDPATQDVTVPALPITPTPVITYNETATEMVITATGQGTVTMIVDGQTYSGEGTVSVTIPRGLEDRTVTATATAVAPNHQPSAQAEETITIHEAGRSPMPTFTFTDNGDGSYTVTVTGTGEVNVYINDAEHGGTAGDPIATGNGSVSFTVEEHSQAMTLPLQATNQEEGLAVSRTAEATYNIPAMTITDDFKPLDPQPANANTPINLSKLMFVDRFSKEIPDRNNHPRLYDYYLQETQVRQRTSNSVEVEVKHTGSDGMGFYTLTQIDNDTIVGLDRKQGLKMNVRNAAMEIPLEPDPKVFFYTVERGTRAYPDQADRKWLGVLQRTTDGNYKETLNPSYDYEEVYPARPHIHYDTDTIDGEYNEYLTYVPVVWTMGFDRYNYRMGIDEVHNSYGAPKWRTGVADVNVETVNVERQLGTLGSTNWTEAGIPCSMYMIDTLTVKGFMPTVNTMPYEPYMFRVFVESKNGKLRGYKKVGDGAVINDGTHYEGDGNGPQTGPICVWSEYVKGSKYMGFTDNTVTFSRGKISEVDTLDHWIVPDYKNMMFAATDTLLTEVDLNGNTVIQKDELNIFVRFYYIVEGSAEGHTPGLMSLRGNRDGEAPAGYGSESPGTSPSPSTAVREISVGSGTVVSQTYYNVQGMESDQPFNGVNIVVTRYSDGTTRTSKVVIVR